MSTEPRSWRSVVPLAAFACCLALGGLAAPPADAAELLVTDFTDDPASPAPGSLRALVAAAQPGDVIRFGSPLLIPLRADLEIRKDGVTLVGRAGLQRASDLPGKKLPALRVRGSGVVLDDLEFRDLVVVADPPSNKGRIAGFTVRNCDFRGRGQLAMLRCDGAVVEDLEMTLDNTGGKQRSALTGLFVLGGVGTRIERFDVTNVRGDALQAVEVTGLTVREGRMDGDADVSPGLQKGAAAGVFEPGELLIEQVDFVENEVEVIRARSGPLGPSRVRNCTAGRLRVSTARAEVTDNVVSLPDAHPLFAVGPRITVTNANLDGAMRVVHNRTRGGTVGIEVTCYTSGQPCTVSDNIVEEAANIGLTVAISDPAVLERNEVTGGLTLGSKIGIALAGDSPSMVASQNVVHDTDGEGIRILQEVPGITLKGNVVRDNAGPGIYVQDRCVAEIEGGTVERNGSAGDTFGGNDAGIVFDRASRGSVVGTVVRDNAGPGVYVWKTGTARLSRLSCTGNGGPGIDVERRGLGFLPSKRTAPPFPTDLAFDGAERAVTGKAIPGGLIGVYRVEDGARAGNPEYGEGVEFLAEGTVDPDGTFSVPVNCQNGEKLTVTVTRPGARAATNEFSKDVECKGPEIEVVSVSPTGAPADDESSPVDINAATSSAPTIAGGGRWIAFVSQASNLTSDVHSGSDQHVFLRDLETDTTIRVTRPASGSFTPGYPGVNGLLGFRPSISEDGRWIAYATASKEVIAGADSPNYPYTVLFDAQNGTTVAVSDPIPRQAGNAFPSGDFTLYGGTDPCISGDGSAVAFVSIGRDWIPGSFEGGYDKDLFVWTRATGTVEWASVTTGGGEVTSSTFSGPSQPRFSFDGRHLAFSSPHDYTGNGSAPQGAVYVRDRVAGTTEAVSLDSGGIPRPAISPQISSDGRWVVFETSAALVPTDTDGRSDIYLRDREAGTTIRVSLRADGTPFPSACNVPVMSGDARFIAFVTKGQYMVPEGLTVVNVAEIHLVDRQKGTVVEAAIGESGEAYGDTISPVLSRDGRLLAFRSYAPNLVPSVIGSNYESQVYLRRLKVED